MIYRNSSIRAAASNGPITILRPIVPNDDADLPDGVTRGLFVGVAGFVEVVDESGTVVRIPSGAAQYHPLAVRRVRALGTTATDLIALY